MSLQDLRQGYISEDWQDQH